jgi:two-component system response regulator QseB
VRLLLVEDDPMIGEGLREHLRRLGYAIDWVRDGEAALLAARTESFDLILLDLGLPRRDGLAVLRELRASRNDTPVLVITARDAVTDRIAGLDSGADDYLVKPFDPAEVAARVRALLRRRAGRADNIIEAGELRLNLETRQVALGGREVALSAREFAVLHALLERPGAILSRAQLEQRLYGWDDEIESNALDVHIHALRRKLGAQLIQNVRGVGWRVPAP